MSGKRLTGRDYKRPTRTGMALDLARVRELSIGFGAGLAIAGLVYLYDHRAQEPAPPALRPTPRHAAASDNGSDVAVDASSVNPPPGDGKYDFYEMLPKFEVVVPEKERGARVAPTAQIDRPGIYFLQIGSYRDEAVANRTHAQVAKLGIDSTVQRVAVDNDVWHRVRVGPIKDLARLNHLREQLRASNLDSLVIRVDE